MSSTVWCVVRPSRSPCRRPCARSGTGPSRGASGGPRASPRGRASPARHRPGAALIRDPTRSSSSDRPTTSNRHRQLRPALVPVLDRVHRGLGDGGLQPLEPLRRQRRARDRGGDPLHRLALVAGVARHARTRPAPLPFAVRGRRHGCRRRSERHERDVVLLLPGRAGEAVELGEQAVDQRRSADRRRSHQRPRRGKPNISPLGSCASTRPSLVEQQALARLDHRLLLVVRHARHQAERHARRPQLDARRSPSARTAGCGRRSRSGDARRRVEHGVEAGDEHLRRHVGAEQVVRRGSSTAPGATTRWAAARRTLRVAAMTIAAGTPLSVTSPTTRPTVPSGELDEVVEVAADLARRSVVRRDLPAGEVRAAPAAGSAAG